MGALTGLSGYADAGIHQALTRGTPAVWYGVGGAWIYSVVLVPLIAIATVFTVLLVPQRSAFTSLAVAALAVDRGDRTADAGRGA